MKKVTGPKPLKQIRVKGFGVRFSDARPGAPRAKHSAWFLTISTNKGERQCDVNRLSEEFYQTLLNMCEREGLTQILDFKPAGHALSTHLDLSAASVVVEVGNHPKGSRVHAHILLNVRHFSQVALNRTAINDYVVSRIETVPLENLYINWKIVGYSLNIEEYMNKFRKREV